MWFILFLIVFIVLIIIFCRLDCNPILGFYEKFAPNRNELRDKTVWIVGASTGIGEELAYQLAGLNCRLILTSTTESKLEEVKKNIVQNSRFRLKDEDVLTIAYNITDLKQNDVAFEKIIKQFGDIDILVCNAGRVFGSKILDDDFDSAKKLFDTNLFSHVYISKMVIKHWIKNKEKDKLTKLNKQIVATSSIAAYVVFSFLSHYSITKKAMNIFFQDIAMQHEADGIYITIACPGPVVSSIIEKSLPSQHQMICDESRQMATSRCVELMIIAMANKLNEVWITYQPILTLIYLNEAFSYYFIWLIRSFNLRGFIEKKFFKNQMLN